jgi:hypothetical protein
MAMGERRWRMGERSGQHNSIQGKGEGRIGFPNSFASTCVCTTLAAHHYSLQTTYCLTLFGYSYQPPTCHSNMANRFGRTEKTAERRASPPPDATKSALLQTLDALLKNHDALSANQQPDLEEQLEKSITEGKTKLCDALAAWAVTRRQSSETERPTKETAAIRGLISAIDRELKAEKQECWKEDGEIGPLQTALKTFTEACGISDANTNMRKPPWKPHMYTRMEESGKLFSFKLILANNL